MIMELNLNPCDKVPKHFTVHIILSTPCRTNVCACLRLSLCVCVPNAFAQNAQVSVGGWVCAYSTSACVSEHFSPRHQFSKHVAPASRRWETCGKRQLWRVKTFFMDDFLWHSWGTGERGWEANELRGREGGGWEGWRWQDELFLGWKEEGGGEEKTAEEITGLKGLWGEIKRKNKCWECVWGVV